MSFGKGWDYVVDIWIVDWDFLLVKFYFFEDFRWWVKVFEDFFVIFNIIIYLEVDSGLRFVFERILI